MHNKYLFYQNMYVNIIIIRITAHVLFDLFVCGNAFLLRNVKRKAFFLQILKRMLPAVCKERNRECARER